MHRKISVELSDGGGEMERINEFETDSETNVL
jgi:hypothetical protein